jgi:hypothetical protein
MTTIFQSAVPRVYAGQEAEDRHVLVNIMLTPIIGPSAARCLRKAAVRPTAAQRFLTSHVPVFMSMRRRPNEWPSAMMLLTDPHPLGARSIRSGHQRYQSSATKLSLTDRLSQAGMVTVITGKLSVLEYDGEWL